jgi:hypothetical protein
MRYDAANCARTCGLVASCGQWHSCQGKSPRDPKRQPSAQARLSIETIQIDLNSVVAAVADQVSCDLEGEAAVLNLKTGVYYGLDDIGAAIWRMLNEPRRVDELVDALLGEYEVDREECQRDVIALLGELAVRGLVEINDGPER